MLYLGSVSAIPAFQHNPAASTDALRPLIHHGKLAFPCLDASMKIHPYDEQAWG